MDVRVRVMRSDDAEAVLHIYGEGMQGGMATLETELPSWERWDAAHRRDCRLVADVEGAAVGWAALLPVSPRAVYAGVAEVSVYVRRAFQGRGVGRALLRRLIEHSETAGIWTLQASILAENEPSLALHRAAGFRIVGRRERIGRRGGRGPWRDVVLLERRSCRVGGDDECE